MRLRFTCLMLLLGLLALPAAGKVTVSGKRFYDPVKGKLIAGRGVVYMQPNAMHHLFWSNLELDRIAADFRLFKERGFDTVVIKPNWGDFVPAVWYLDAATPQPQLSTTAFDQLDLIVDLAAENDLYVLIMSGLATVPHFYTDNGVTPVSRIWTANYWCRIIDLNVYPPANYADTNCNIQWNNFQAYLADALEDKDNILGFVIEPETSQIGRDLTTTEVAGWNNAIKGADSGALTGYTPFSTINSTNCNMANTDVIFGGSYPNNSTQAGNASNVSTYLASVRTYNTTKPIFMRETGVDTYSYTTANQASYVRALRNICEAGSERFAGYAVWMSQEFSASAFAAPNSPATFDLQQAAFGMFSMNGIAKPVVASWIDLLTPNRSFETLGTSSRPQGWESAWTYNGTPTGWSVTRSNSGPYNGSYVLRMFTGTGAPASTIFCSNTNTAIQALPNVPYTVSAYMRYALSTGNVKLAVLEYDASGNLTQSTEKSWTGGSWTWQKNSIDFITHPNTTSCYVRFGIGGQASEYLDVDLQDVQLAHRTPNASFELDANTNSKPDNWETAGLWNGSRTGWSANIGAFSTNVVNGLNCLRINSGTSGSAGARVIVDSDFIPAIPSKAYNFKTYMRWDAGASGTVDWWVIQFDAAGTQLTSNSGSFSGTDWNWQEKSLSFTTQATTAKFIVRFTAGGQAGQVLYDVDWVRDYTP